MRTLVLASHNRKKLAELSALLTPAGWALRPVSDFSAIEPDESAPTFVENALIKARHATQVSGLPAIADDSGLEVASLQGAPGVLSARYAGRHGDDAANNAKLLAALRGKTGAARQARFVCAIALLRHGDDPLPILSIGTWAGAIAETPQGTGGFGYDPLFWLPALGKSAAELAPALKNRLSHRGRALRGLLRQLRDEPGS
jgi:XTP/dITP diphosphohydrolase